MYEQINPQKKLEEIGKEQEKKKICEMTRSKLSILFKTYLTGEERVEAVDKEMSTLYKFLENSDQISSDIKRCIDIDKKKEFIDAVMTVIEPIIDLRVNKPDAFVPEGVSGPTYAELNELVSYEIDGDRMHFHMLPEKRVENFPTKFKEGLQKLAKIVSGLEDIRTVEGASFIVASNAKFFERYGFIIDGDADDETKEKYFPSDKRKIWRLHLDRDDFLKKYLKSANAG